MLGFRIKPDSIALMGVLMAFTFRAGRGDTRVIESSMPTARRVEESQSLVKSNHNSQFLKDTQLGILANYSFLLGEDF
uniref:Uncharacterized protein n=1 Tax=Nelumbo nucifera TaxID=4432 RepID=A0A822Y9N0_NELNU|nr:TPA_asm: hypothetical protein HUJ06_030575 [Nelumbo nucifera]